MANPKKTKRPHRKPVEFDQGGDPIYEGDTVIEFTDDKVVRRTVGSEDPKLEALEAELLRGPPPWERPKENGSGRR